VLSSGVHARYLARPREYPAQVEFYEAVASAFEEVARFDGPEYLGPRIIVYRRPPELAWNDLRGIPEGFFDQLAGNGPLAEYLAQLGGILDRQGRQDLAYRILNAAVDIDPKNGKVWAGLAVAQLADGKFEDSLLSFRKARDLAPDRAEIAFNQGTLFRRMGEMRQASDAYRDALGLDSSFQDAYIALARVLVEDTRYGEARLVLQEFLARFPRSPMRGSAETALRELASMGPGRP